MARGKRTRIAPGIYRDALGWAVVVSVNGQKHERRFKGLPELAKLEAFRVAWLRDLREDAARRARAKGTLAGDVETYLATLPAKTRRRANAALELGHWCAAYGDRPRASLTSVDIATQLARWHAAGLAPSTINHRRQELSNLYATLDGKAAANPVREVPRMPERYDEPRGLPLVVVSMIVASMGRSKGQARLRVMATTGLPPSQIARLTPRDVDLRARTVYVRPRRKGAGVPGRTLPLTRRAVAALRCFTRRDCWGTFSRHSLARDFARAVAKAKRRWARRTRAPWPAPEDVRPYDVRHSFLTEAYRRTGDLRAVAELALHADLNTTRRYAEAAVSETAQRAIAAMDGDRLKRNDGQRG